MSRLPPKAATAFHYLVIPVSLSLPHLRASVELYSFWEPRLLKIFRPAEIWNSSFGNLRKMYKCVLHSHRLIRFQLELSFMQS